MSITKSIARSVLFLALIATAGTGCSHLFYQPSDVMFLEHPESVEKLRREVEFRSADGTKLSGWYFPARAGGHKGTVIQFHGNAQNLTAHFVPFFG